MAGNRIGDGQHRHGRAPERIAEQQWQRNRRLCLDQHHRRPGGGGLKPDLRESGIRDLPGWQYDNAVQGNLIGTDLTGTHALGNLIDGVTDNGGSGNTIGGTATGEGNLISANLAHGISLTGASRDEVLGNHHRHDTRSDHGLPLQVPAAGQPGQRNPGYAGAPRTPSAAHRRGGQPGRRQQDSGIILSGADSNVVSGNAMGTTLATGSCIGIGPPVNLGNASDGIFLLNSSGNTIGGADQLDPQGNITLLGGNVVSSNGQAGISVLGNDSFLPGRAIRETSSSGTLWAPAPMAGRSVGNASIGIMVGDSANNTIGGVNVLNPDGSLISFSGNLVSGNPSQGPSIQ